MRALSKVSLQLIHGGYPCRCGFGDFVLLGWNANKKTPTRPTSGTQLLAFTARGASKIRKHLEGATPAPWDIVLIEMLTDVELSAVCCMSYVYPAIGGYGAHVSTATPKPGDPTCRCDWKARHLYEGAGSLPESDTRGGRWICGRTRSGPAHYLQKVDYTLDLWLTQRPPDYHIPTSTDDSQKILRSLLEQREWLDDSGKWTGPPLRLMRDRVKHKGWETESPEPIFTDLPSHIQALIDKPGERVSGIGDSQEFGRMAAEFVVDTADYPWYADVPKRTVTKRRSNLSVYKRRIFTDDEDWSDPLGRSRALTPSREH